MANIRISARAKDEAGNSVAGGGFEIRAYRSGTTTAHTEYLNEAGTVTFTPPGRPSTSTSTTIAASAASGQDMIQVASTTGFAVGDTVIVAGGGNREEHLIRALLTGPTRIQVATNLANTFASGTVGGAECKGAWVRYVPDTFNADAEIKVVATGKTYPRITFPTKAVGYTGVQEEGSDLTQRSKIDFRGAMVKASDDSGSGTTKVDVDRRQTITHTAGTLAIDFALGTTVEVALQANTGSMTFTGLVAGMWFSIQFAQDVTGSRTIAFASTIKWEGGTTPTWTTTASKKDKMLGYYDGTDITAIAVLNS